MKIISEKYIDFFEREIILLQRDNRSLSLSKINEEVYIKWQNFFREEYPKKPLLFDVAWAINR